MKYHEDMPSVLHGKVGVGFLLFVVVVFHKFKTLTCPGTQLRGRLREFHNVSCLAHSQELFTDLEILSQTVLSGQVVPVRQSTFVTSPLTRACLSEALLNALCAHIPWGPS